MSLRKGSQVFMVFTSLRGGSKRIITDLPVVVEFPEVLSDDIGDFPPEQEVELVIDLIPSTSPASMAPYGMYAPELSELKK